MGHKKRGDFSKPPQDNENETWIYFKHFACFKDIQIPV